MQFTTLTLSALSIGSALAQNVHVVTVGGTNGTKEFSPNNVVAAVGDLIQFQYNGANHTVTQSSFDLPCQPIAQTANVSGVFSGFMPVAESDTMRPAFTIPVTSTTPMWLYCSQATHCQAGMVMVVNENTAANATRSLTNYAAGASAAPTGLAIPSSAASSSNSGSSSSGTSSSSGSSTSSNPAQVSNSSGAGRVAVSSLLGLAVGVLVLMI